MGLEPTTFCMHKTKEDPSDAARRVLGRRRRDCELALERAEHRLALAHEAISRLGRLDHRHERAELQAEIAREAAAVRLAERQLAVLRVERVHAPAVEARREPTRPALSRTREVDRGFGLEL